LAAEDELSPTPVKRKRKEKVARKKTKIATKSIKKTKKGRGVKRRVAKYGSDMWMLQA
jgi:hypothetical protein